jgi:hypothetical protein
MTGATGFIFFRRKGIPSPSSALVIILSGVGRSGGRRYEKNENRKTNRDVVKGYSRT